MLHSACNLHPDNNVGWPNVDPTSVLSTRRWANVVSTYISVWLVRLWRWLPIRMTHKTEPAPHRAAGFCATWWCVARLCASRLGCVEDHPCTCSNNIMHISRVTCAHTISRIICSGCISNKNGKITAITRIAANLKFLQVPFSLSRYRSHSAGTVIWLIFWWAGTFSSNSHYSYL